MTHAPVQQGHTMPKIEIYDPPMCCSTGVCGPEPDERLSRFTADLDWLKRSGAEVRRYNLAQEPAAFTTNPEVAKIVNDTGGDGLPIVVIDGRVVSQAAYPSREQLAELAGLSGDGAAKHPPIFDERVAELVALGAAIAANCEPCLRYHHRIAMELGINSQDMIQAANVALKVKEQPSRAVVQAAQRLLMPESTEAAPTGGCCGGTGCC